MKKKNGKGSTRTHVESLKHKDKRANIPTRELRDFVAEDEQQPKTIVFPGLLYARDPSLDLQLVWKGKEEQDQKALEVLAVLIYIQERIPTSTGSNFGNLSSYTSMNRTGRTG